MTLTKPRQAWKPDDMGVDLQRETAMRVQARVEAEIKAKRHAEAVQRVKTGLAVLFVTCVAGVGLWAWKSGKFDDVLPGGEVSEPAPTAEATPFDRKAVRGEPVRAVPAPKTETVLPTVEENARAYADAEEQFAGATVDDWKNAVKEDRPAKGKSPLLFTGLVPDGKGGHVLLSLQIGGGKGLVAAQISPNRGLVELTRAEFDRLVEKKPYLVVREGRAYVSMPGADDGETSAAVPPKGGAFNPAKVDLGVLYDRLAVVKTKRPAFRYEVLLTLERFKKTVPVATVGFDEEVPRAAFARVARTLVDDADTCEIILDVGRVTFRRIPSAAR